MEIAIRGLTAVSDQTAITRCPDREGQQRVLTPSDSADEPARDTWRGSGCSTAATRASTSPTSTLYRAVPRDPGPNKIACERGKPFGGFEKSAYASGEFFDKYVDKAGAADPEGAGSFRAGRGFTSPTRTTGVR